MPLVGKVGWRRPRARMAMGCLYLVLCLGAVTTVYPFLLMVSTSFKGTYDQNDNLLVPLFWSDEEELFRKYRDDKYAGDAPTLAATDIGHEATEAQLADYDALLRALPLDYWRAGFRVPSNNVTSRLNLRYQDWLRERYGGDIDALNTAYVELNVGFMTVNPPSEQYERLGWLPNPGPKWDDWLEFKATLPAEYRIPVRAESLWQNHLRQTYQSQIDAIPAELRGTAKTFETLRLPDPAHPDWQRFRAEKLPERFRQVTVEELWNRMHPGPLPIVAAERAFVAANAEELRREFTARNYAYIGDAVALNGRALLNTAIFCALAVLTALTVNPLAAYVLSRYPGPATPRILLFLLATMAFPAEVAMIPQFLMLRDLGLLNTFWALVLPSAANGFTIFLLKGFFDSLPQEIFESGQLDGAKEWQMLLRLALPLSKPVLGYVALLAFMGAYGAFLFAFLIVQDERMWTLMVYIYQLQIVAPKAVVMAAITLAALPTLLVFLFAQNVIMRGIVLPDER